MPNPEGHLSQRQQDILGYIQSFVDEHGHAPLIRQIQDQFDIASASVVAYNLKVLESKGYLNRRPISVNVGISATAAVMATPIIGVSIQSQQDQTSQSSGSVSKLGRLDRPPQFGEYLLYFLPKQKRESLIGDLEEEYHDVLERQGTRRAWFWYYGQVCMSFLPLLIAVIGRIVRWGIFAWIGDLVRHILT